MNDSEELLRLRAEVEALSRMSDIGELSAGIAHEIQNPLNFVINFDKLSQSLIKDMEEILEEEKGLSDDGRDDLEDIAKTLKLNLGKILEHGQRASSIVQNIMLYIRGKKDEFIPTNLPNLVKEYLLLSYHASRTADKSFNVSFTEEYDSGLEGVNLIAQDFSRAVLNIFNNAFYTLKERFAIKEPGYMPSIHIVLKNNTDSFSLSIEDNGMGMSPEVKENLFKKYLTTKPVGQGTGLGLMLVKRIIEDQHHGKIVLESEAGKFTRFSFIIPITNKQ